MAALGFLAVVLSHQLILGFISYLLGYETQITFGQVISKPFDNRYWSANRVLLMYAVPTVVYLFGACLMAFYLLYIVKEVDRWYWFLFWCMVFSVLFITTQFTLAPLASFTAKGPIYQGISVVANWWGVDTFNLLIFSFISLLINIVFGIISFRLLMQLSPSRTTMQKKNTQRAVILNCFVYPIALLLPLAILLAYPQSILFFVVMFLHSLFWLPGLIMKTQHGYRFEGMLVKYSEVSQSNALLVVIVLAVILVRVFM